MGYSSQGLFDLFPPPTGLSSHALDDYAYAYLLPPMGLSSQALVAAAAIYLLPPPRGLSS